MELYDITQTPKEVLDLLYEMRFIHRDYDLQTGTYSLHDLFYEEVTGAYEFIVADNVVYCKDPNSERVKKYLNEDRTYTKGMIPDAIIYNGLVLKNRYGMTSFNKKIPGL